MFAWGAGGAGSDGYPHSGQSIVPADLGTAVQVAAGDRHSAARLARGTVRCWGENSAGQCLVPEDLADAISIAAGQSFTLALRSSGSVVGWSESYAQVPNGLTRVTQIAAGSHGLALLDSQVSGCGNPQIGRAHV